MLRDCLRSIYDNAPTFSFEVIVVDNVSVDGAIDMMESEFPKVKIIRNTQRHGFGHNQNTGINECKGEYIFVYNDDTLVHGNALTKLCDFLDKHPDVGVVGQDYLTETAVCNYRATNFLLRYAAFGRIYF